MRESNNITDLLAKIDWEGGIPELLDYGVRSIDEFDVSDELKDAWDEMVSYFLDFEGCLEHVWNMLHQEEHDFENGKGL